MKIATKNIILNPYKPLRCNNYIVIIKYCLDHADKVAVGQDVVQEVVSSGMVPSSMMENHANKLMTNIHRLFKNFNLIKRLAEKVKNIRLNIV